jgi:hypothetical protein
VAALSARVQYELSVSALYPSRTRSSAIPIGSCRRLIVVAALDVGGGDEEYFADTRDRSLCLRFFR